MLSNSKLELTGPLLFTSSSTTLTLFFKAPKIFFKEKPNYLRESSLGENRIIKGLGASFVLGGQAKGEQYFYLFHNLLANFKHNVKGFDGSFYVIRTVLQWTFLPL